MICWILVGSLPFTLPAAIAWWPSAPVQPAAWLGFAYVTLFSMWLGFFAWYRGLALGGTVRVSQVQLLQPFLALLFAVPVLGEKLRAGDAVLFAGGHRHGLRRAQDAGRGRLNPQGEPACKAPRPGSWRAAPSGSSPR